MANASKSGSKSGGNHNSQQEDAIHPPASLFFSKTLPWQGAIWQQLSRQLNQNRLPHALLVAGMAGLGKRQLVWQFIAYALCEHPTHSVDVINKDSEQINTEPTTDAIRHACGHCQSCLWLNAGTHPNLRVLPYHHQPMSSNMAQTPQSNTTGNRNKKTSNKTSNNKSSQRNSASNASKPLSSTIKIDDIRGLSAFLTQHSRNVRFCVLDHADAMTMAASNALLKSLEEPVEGMYFILISDNPANLLPTIISRVQRVVVAPSFSQAAVSYVLKTLTESASEASKANEQTKTDDEVVAQQIRVIPSQMQVEQALSLAGGAPLSAKDMLQAPWFSQRENWLKTWRALYLGTRSVTAASDFWQQTLPLEDFLTLSGLMLDDMARIHAGMDSLQQDINWDSYQKLIATSQNNQLSIRQSMAEVKQALQQNVQEKLSYDKLLYTFTDKT